MRNNRKRTHHVFSKTKKVAVYSRDNFRCMYCERQFEYSDVGTKFLTIDHVIPVIKDGTHDWNNIVTCCLDCNIRKSDDDLMFFLTRHDYDEDIILYRMKQAFGRSYKEARRNAQGLIRIKNHEQKLQDQRIRDTLNSRFVEVDMSTWRYDKCEF